MEQYYKTYEVRWSDLDPNRHLANSRYTDLATHTRFCLLNENGFGQNEFAKHQFGPIIFGEEISYFKEVLFGEKIFIDFEVSGMTHDGRFYQFQQGFYKENGDQAALLILRGSWMNLTTRKLDRPKPEMMPLFDLIPRSEGFRTMEFSEFKAKMLKPKVKIFGE
jgi:acyl-CoA thioester hydrolase